MKKLKFFVSCINKLLIILDEVLASNNSIAVLIKRETLSIHEPPYFRPTSIFFPRFNV